MRRSKTRAAIGAGIVAAALLFGTPAPPADAAVPKDTTPRCVTIPEWKALHGGMRGGKVRRILGLRSTTHQVRYSDGTIRRYHRPCARFRAPQTIIVTETRQGRSGVWRLRYAHASFHRVPGWTA